MTGEGILARVAAPRAVVVHEPECCACCGESLAGAELVGVERRQVFDLPPESLPPQVFAFVARLLAEQTKRR